MKANMNDEMLINFSKELSQLPLDWSAMESDGVFLDNIYRTHAFFKKYIVEIDGPYEFLDYLIFNYIQDKSEYASKILLERIWEDANSLLDFYYENNECFDGYDDSDPLEYAFCNPYQLEQENLLRIAKHIEPTELSEIIEEFYFDDIDFNKLKDLIRQYTFDLERLINIAQSELDTMQKIKILASDTKENPFYFCTFAEDLMEFIHVVEKYIDKVRPAETEKDEENTDILQKKLPPIKPFEISDELLDDLYKLCNATLFFAHTKDQFKVIINGGHLEESKENKKGDIRTGQLNKVYYLVYMMGRVIPKQQYEIWSKKIKVAQNLRYYDKKWNTIRDSASSNSAKEFRKELDELINKHCLR